MINLGDEVQDQVSGFRGIASGVSEFLNGCRRLAVTPRVGKDGKLGQTEWFDEPQLTVIKAAAVKVARRNTGGPMPSVPTRASDPRR